MAPVAPARARASATSPEVTRRLATALLAIRSSTDIMMNPPASAAGTAPCATVADRPRRGRSTSRAVTSTAVRIARALMVAPATWSGGELVHAADQPSAGLGREHLIEQALQPEVVLDDGLVVEHRLGPGDAALEIDTGDHVERGRRVAGRGDDIERREDIGDDLVALEHGDRGGLALFGSEAVRTTRIDDRHDLGREALEELALLGEGGRGEDERDQSDDDDADGRETPPTRSASRLRATALRPPRKGEGGFVSWGSGGARDAARR